MNSISSEAHFRQRVIRYSEKHGVTAASIRHHRSRQAIYEWKSRYDGNWKSLCDRSHRPHSHPNQHTQVEKAMILRHYSRYKDDIILLWSVLKKDGFEVVVDAPVEDESGGDGDEEDNEDENYINFKDSNGATVDLVTYGDLAIRTLTTQSTNGNVKQETTTDAVGNVTKDFTDLVKYNIIKTTDGKNKDTSYEYDLLNNLKSISKSHGCIMGTVLACCLN